MPLALSCCTYRWPKGHSQWSRFPRRTLLGSWLHRGNYKDQTTPYCALTLVHMCCRNTAIILVPVLLSLSPLSDGNQIFSHSPTDPLCCQRQAHTSKPTLNVH